MPRHVDSLRNSPRTSPKNSPRVIRKCSKPRGTHSLAGTPTNSGNEFGSDRESNLRMGGLDRVLLERNLEKLLQEQDTQMDETVGELGRYV